MNRRAATLVMLVLLVFSGITLDGDSVAESVGEVDTTSFISVPSTVEVTHAITVDMRVEPAPPAASDGFPGYALTVTRPDGIRENYTITVRNDHGECDWNYMLNKLGKYTFQFSYPGETFANGTIRYKPSQSPKVVTTTVGDVAPPIETPGGSWAQKRPMTQARGALGIATVNDKIYAIGGCVENGSYPQYPGGLVDTNEEYDPLTDSWTMKARMPTPRSNFAIAACGDKIYCIGGIIGSKLDEIYHLFTVAESSPVNEVYDPATDTWATKAPFPVSVSNVVANSVGDKVYVLSGKNILVYDPSSDSWSTKTPASTDVGGLPSVVVDNKIYVVSNYSPVQIYDALNDRWSQGARSPRMSTDGIIGSTTGVFAPKRIILFAVAQYGWVPYGPSGTDGPSRRTTFIYNPEADVWSAGAIIPVFRVGFGVATIDDRLYAVGGCVLTYIQNNTFTVSAKNEEYTPDKYGAVKPVIHVVSPQSQTYSQDAVSLNFTVDKQTVWLGYSLDGQEKVTVTGNTTIAQLQNGLHNVTVYGNDTLGNLGVSEIVIFTISKETDSLSTSLIMVVSVGFGAALAVWLLFYLKKHRTRQTKSCQETLTKA